jgi:UrcA family protein
MISCTHANTLVLLMLAAVLANSAALADPASGPRMIGPEPVTVRFSDLNLASPEGAGILYNRIRDAARKACGPSFASWYPGVPEKWNACYEETVASAIRQVDRPMLTALYERHPTVASR